MDQNQDKSVFQLYYLRQVIFKKLHPNFIDLRTIINYFSYPNN